MNIRVAPPVAIESTITGHAIAAREDFLTGDITMHTVSGPTIALARLRERACQQRGAFVLFDPYSDGDGLLAVGDNKADLITIAERSQI